LKEEARDFLEPETIKDLVRKYSQFINFNIYLWTSKTETVEEPIEDEAEPEKKDETEEGKKDEEKKDEEKKEDEKKEDEKKEDEDVEVEDAEEDKEKKPKTKKVRGGIFIPGNEKAISSLLRKAIASSRALRALLGPVDVEVG
jgi:heat shock protein beta